MIGRSQKSSENILDIFEMPMLQDVVFIVFLAIPTGFEPVTCPLGEHVLLRQNNRENNKNTSDYNELGDCKRCGVSLKWVFYKGFSLEEIRKNLTKTFLYNYK